MVDINYYKLVLKTQNDPKVLKAEMGDLIEELEKERIDWSNNETKMGDLIEELEKERIDRSNNETNVNVKAAIISKITEMWQEARRDYKDYEGSNTEVYNFNEGYYQALTDLRKQIDSNFSG